MEIGLPKYLQRENQEVESEPWLLSYSDMTTLLLAFFVLFSPFPNSIKPSLK